MRMKRESLDCVATGKLRRAAFVLFAFGVLFAGMTTKAGVTRQLPPLPVNEKDFPKSLIPVVETEHAFATYSIDHGMKEAFLAYAAPNGLIIRRRPVNAIEAWTQTTPPPPGLLTWYPTYADVSRAGDLGWTTGPWEFRDKPTDKAASGNGHFITIWRKQPDGIWKFEMDFGISHAAPATEETSLQYPPALRKAASGGKELSVEVARGSLLEAEAALAKDAESKTAARAFLARSDANVRLYRQNNYPVIGQVAVGRYLEAKAEAVSWHSTDASVARSGDLGYAYGTYESRAAKPSGAKPSEAGNYMRIWRRFGDTWRVVLEVTNPAPPTPAQ